MKKKIISLVIAGAVCWAIGFAIVEISRELEWLALLIGFGGTGIAVFHIFSALIGGLKESDLYNDKKKEISRKKAEQEILRFKTLLDAGVLTQNEFDRKANELKTIILRD